jgi:hypothetical protein
MTDTAIELLEATDRARRRVQHVAISSGVLLLLTERALLRSRQPGPLDLLLISVSLMFILVGMVVKQRWEVEFQEHRIRFENSPMFAERLFIDGKVVARGRVGRHIELRGKVKGTDGRVNHITAVSDAGLWTFRCRIRAENAAGMQPT